MKEKLTWFGIGFVVLLLLGAAAIDPGTGPETAWIKIFKKTADSGVTARTNIFGGLTITPGQYYKATNSDGSGEFSSVVATSTNGVQGINGNASSNQFIKAFVGNGSDISVTTSNGPSGSTNFIEVPTASGTSRGALSTTDWGRFDSIVNRALTNQNVGDVDLLAGLDVGGLFRATNNANFYGTVTADNVVTNRAGLYVNSEKSGGHGEVLIENTNDGFWTQLTMHDWGDGNVNLFMINSDGTVASPTAMTAGENIANFYEIGRTTTQLKTAFSVRTYAVNNWTDGDSRALVTFNVGDNTANNEGKTVMTLTHTVVTNHVDLRVEGNQTVTGTLKVLGNPFSLYTDGIVYHTNAVFAYGGLQAVNGLQSDSLVVTAISQFQGDTYANALLEVGNAGAGRLSLPFLRSNSIPTLGKDSSVTNKFKHYFIETNSMSILSNLVVAASSGDVVELGNGTFYIGVQSIKVPVGVTLRGQGIDRTIISGNVGTGGGSFTNPIVQIASTNTFEDLTIVAGNQSAYFQFPLACRWDMRMPAATNVVIRRVKIVGETDCVYVGHTNYTSGTIENCEFYAKYDTFVAQHETPTTLAFPGNNWILKNSTFVSDFSGATEAGTLAAGQASPVRGGNGVITLINCNVVATNAPTRNMCLYAGFSGTTNVFNVFGGRYEAAGTNGVAIITNISASASKTICNITDSSITHSNAPTTSKVFPAWSPYEVSHLSAGGIKFTGGQATNSLLMVGGNSNMVPATIGSGLTFVDGTLSASAGSGEANTASSLGSGFHVFSDKSGVDLRFNTISNNDGTITISSNNNTLTLSVGAIGSSQITDGTVALTDMANIATDRLLGRDTGGTGPPEVLTASGGIEFTGSGGIQRSALTGDVTSPAGSGTTTIPAGSISNAKFRDSAALTVVGRSVNSVGSVADITSSADGQILRRSAGALSFGQLDLADTDGVTGLLSMANGGTGANLVDPNAHKLLGWDDTAGTLKFFTLQSSTLSYNSGTSTLELDADLVDLADGSLTGTKVGFSDPDGLWTASNVESALAELNDSINAGVPNGVGAKVHWSQLLGVPAGFADGTDDGAGGGATTNQPVQAFGWGHNTNGMIFGWVHLNANTNIWVDWKGTNKIICSPSNTFTITYSNAPTLGDYDQTIELQIRNTNSAAGYAPYKGPNGKELVLLPAPSTNFFYLRFDGTNHYILDGQMATTGLNDTNVMNVQPTIYQMTMVGSNIVSGNLGWVNNVVTGVGGANTNFTLLATQGKTIINGFTNVSIRAMMGGVVGLTYSFSISITNGSGSNRTLEFSDVTNSWRWSYAQGAVAPSVITNLTKAVITGEIEGTNVIASYAYYAWP